MDERILSALRDGATVVTASRRLARAFRTQYAAVERETGARAWVSPAVLSWSAWLDALWEEFLFRAPDPPLRLSAWQEAALWQAAVENAEGASALLQVSAAAEEARKAYSLAAQWRLDLSQVEAAGNDDVRAFAAWARYVSTVCQKNNWLEAAHAPDAIAKAIPLLPVPRRLLFAGFDEFAPQQRGLLDACAAAGCMVEAVAAPVVPPSGKAVRAPFQNTERELDTAARWARAKLERNPAARIGVVIPELSARRNAVERAFRAALEPGSQRSPELEPCGLLNISAGLPLSRYPVLRSALAILSLSPGANEWADLSALTLDRFLAGSETERAARARLDRNLRRLGLAEITLDELRREASAEAAPCPVLEQSLAQWQAAYSAAPEAQGAAAWAGSFAAALRAFGWPGERRPSSSEFQTVEAWRKALSEFAATDFVAGALTRSQALSLLRRVVSQTDFQPEGPDAPVQIMGVLEAAGLAFDHLWIAGLHDEAWPGPPNPTPFLPVRLQREAGLPRCSPEREYAFASLITSRLLASAPDVVVSYPVSEGDRELAPSPLVISVPRVEVPDLEQWRGEAWATSIRASRQVERLVDEQGPALAPGVWQRGGARVFKHQAGCPFRAFAEVRLGAEDLESPAPGLDARQRGTLLHETLEAFWGEVHGHAELLARGDIPQVIRECARAALARLEDRRGCPLPAKFAELECRRLESIVAEWLEVERQREPFDVVQPERERTAEVGGVQFRLRIDRIDRLPDGREIIIDYKTGAPHPSQWEGDRPEDPQLPLYAVIHEKPLAGLLFAHLETGKPRWLGIAEGGVPGRGVEQADIPQRIAEWRVVLERLAREFREGRAEADPKDPAKTCQYCPLPPVCRGAERDLACLREEEE